MTGVAVLAGSGAGCDKRFPGRVSSLACEVASSSSPAGSRAKTGAGTGRAAGATTTAAGRVASVVAGATDFERRRITVSLMRSSVVLSFRSRVTARRTRSTSAGSRCDM
jgi:hypothetical protein